MAALQKIRSKGGLLIAIIGLGLFAFIAEEFFRSIETTTNQSKMQVGKIYGETISSQELQNMFESYENALKFMRGVNSLSESETTQARDYVWQSYVNYALIKHECDKLGITVTDDELQKVLTEGTHPILAQTPFRSEKSNLFDVSLLKNFLQEYDKMKSGKSTQEVPQQYMEYYDGMFNYWKFVEKTLRENLLEQKYQDLLSKCIISNPVEAQLFYDGTVNRSNILLASYPYTSVEEKDIAITDAELKAKYDEQKERYHQYIETRDIKYISVAIEASEKDKIELIKEMETLAVKMNETDDYTNFVRTANSLVPYSKVPVSGKALPYDIQKKLEDMSVGAQDGPYLNSGDNTQNIVKLLAKVQVPDSVQFRQIQVGGANADEAHNRADSIFNAIKGGASFSEIAKVYGQKGDSTWLTSAQYEKQTIDDENANFINKLNNLPVGQLTNIAFSQGNIIVEVVARKAVSEKYDVAVIKRPVEFSKETYNKAYNKFSHFVATNTVLDSIEVNAAKEGYSVQSRSDMYNTEHAVAGVSGTREALKWIFDAKKGDVSPLYECGENDHLLLVALTGIHEVGYRPLADVKDLVREEIMRDKKAEKVLAKFKDIKTIDAAGAIAGVALDSLNDVSFVNDAMVARTGAMESVISGSIWGKKTGDVSGPLKGDNGVYFYQVVSQSQQPKKYEVKEWEKQAAQYHSRSLASFGSDLYLNAKVMDKRYLFF